MTFDVGTAQFGGDGLRDEKACWCNSGAVNDVDSSTAEMKCRDFIGTIGCRERVKTMYRFSAM
jgi:hypothetical protein